VRVRWLKTDGKRSLPNDNRKEILTMNDKEARTSQLGTRMNDFGAGQASDFSPTSLGGQKFAALNALVASIDLFGSKQALSKGSAQTSTEAKRELRTRIRQQMKAIRDTALALESEQPGIAQSFRMPPTNGDEPLINSARAFVEAATPLKTQFTSRELPATFLADLSAAVASFEESVSSFNQHRGNRLSAAASLQDALAQVIKLRRELDPIVRNKFRNDPAVLASWESASHLERAPTKRKKDDKQTVAPTK
jgi:hypothetical protein